MGEQLNSCNPEISGLTDALKDLRDHVGSLSVAAGNDGPVAEDAAVIQRRLEDAEDLVARLSASRTRAEASMTRHDALNALGAIDNFAELIGLEAGLTEADHVRGAVRRVVAGLQASSVQGDEAP